ncbi:UxaA family hydrolase [Oharaeibacter diazotrophicus]|uniref:Altronate hydrolase n=1 Tax=Oharaeibacter diazotrophicus TaxID=1920512 RepID=A0A4R6R9V8_9HYPH|nr:altronate dehydratase family protein [Oharaeibacter diazotrophicus]TDP82772.1 altronate hydrolase [Oharaeibacter diazotrophicus]BBE72466.1 D-galactarate dehydratase [Pleomorphomonas sp. SM30]GLS76497.1 dehydratase [Oharaeibacter diazotrophicus]
MNAPDRTPRTLRLHPTDNVLVALDPIDAGRPLDGGLVAAARVPKGHKIAAAAIPEGAPVVKFGQIIGFATADIVPGAHVHVHNVGVRDFERHAEAGEAAERVSTLPPATFEGFRRADGKVGTRNYIGILTSVNCSATVAKYIAQAVERSGILEEYDNVDGVVSLVHGNGCGMAGRGEGYDLIERTQWGYASHPNFAGVLLVGLGCEVFQIPRLKERYGIVEGDHFRSFTIQDTGGTRRSIEAGVGVVREMLPRANAVRRETVPASALVVGMQCGGSDGYSGITANPALGYAADLLAAQGGTAILSETPEIYGAEHLLAARAETPEIAEKLMERIRWWEEYTARNGGEMDNNPSPGNKAGGLTTILEKSLGAAAKGGTSPLRGVYEYAEPIDTDGFVFMDSPGYDPVSATGQIASGANLIAFTTGRGSAFGAKPVPSMKLATNSDLYARMTEDMDVNCGDVLDGVPLEEKGRQIFEKMLAVASGEHTRSEDLGYGDAEFVPWHVGAVM